MEDDVYRDSEPDRLPIEWPAPTERVEPEPEPAAPPPGKWATIGVPILAGFVGAALAVGAVAVFDVLSDDPAPETVVERVVTEIANPVDVSSPTAAVARKVVPSIVTIQINSGTFGAGSGSGVVLDETSGYIVTNEHVVAGSTNVGVVLHDGRIYEAEVLGVDELTDLAVVKIDAVALTAIERGSSLELGVGDTAIAIGNPLGLEGGPSVTAGVISAFDRVWQPNNDVQLIGMLQTDAPITRGSSGGALVDDQGRLIGITTAVGFSDLGPERLGFATPVEVVERVADDIINEGVSRHAFLGIQGQTATELQADGGAAPAGVRVVALLGDSSAGGQGIEEGDIITNLDGDTVHTMEQLISALRRFSPGERIELDVERDGEPLTVVLLLGERPPGA